MRVHALWIYPIKGCQGISLNTCYIDENGPALDRRFMLVNSRGRFISQRTDPLLATVRIRVQGSMLIVTSTRMQRVLMIQTTLLGTACEVRIWKDTVTAIDCGDTRAEWFSELLGKPVRLVRIRDNTRLSRGVSYHEMPVNNGFADGYPLLITSLASLNWLKAQYGRQIPMQRFRPNIIIQGEMDPFDEDHFAEMRIGSVPVMGIEMCERCPVINVTQTTGERRRGDELRQFLRSVRAFKGAPGGCFGLRADHLGTGVLRVGSLVRVDSRILRHDQTYTAT